MEIWGCRKGSKDGNMEQRKIGSNKTKVNDCYACKKENPGYEVTCHSSGKYIQQMKYNTLIVKFIRMWPSEKSLTGWMDREIFHRETRLHGSPGLYKTILVFTRVPEKSRHWKA
jgi:hypothetical protein